MTTVEVLREAREEYAARPSHAGFGRPPASGRSCLVMACRFDEAALYAIARAAPFEMFNWNEGAIRWNAEHTTKQVLAAFDRAISAEEARS